MPSLIKQTSLCIFNIILPPLKRRLTFDMQNPILMTLVQLLLARENSTPSNNQSETLYGISAELTSSWNISVPLSDYLEHAKRDLCLLSVVSISFNTVQRVDSLLSTLNDTCTWFIDC